ncbi:MAG: membrane dipeptidase [bacterium]|nr:membrane dipeptidase [bacterium]
MDKKIPVIDLHEDLLLHVSRRELYPADHWQTNFEMLKEQNFKVVVSTAFPVPPQENFFDPASNAIIEHDFQTYKKYCSECPEWSIIKNSSDVEAILKDDSRHGFLLHVEGLNVFDGDWEMLERWYGLGWRSLGIVWNLTNPFGGGTKDLFQGLTVLGTQMLDWLQERRMLIDFAHMNKQTFFDTAKLVRCPIIISHGNAAALCPSLRNYDDEQLRVVAKSGGVVGVFFGSMFLVGKEKSPGTVKDIVDHIDHFRKVMGIEYIAIGSDLGGITTGTLSDLNSVQKIDLLWSELRNRGYSEEDIEKISYGNILRVFKEILL